MDNDSLDKNYLCIKEFAEFVGMTVSALRFYDNKGIFCPAKRGVEFENKYRYYSPTQITTVKMIRVLREIGVPLATIKELTEHRTPEKLIKLLNKNKETVADEVRFLQEVYSVMDTFIGLLSEGIGVTETEMSVIEMPEKSIILGNENNFSNVDEFYGEFVRFCNGIHTPQLNMSYPIGGYWTDMDTFLDRPSRPTHFFSLDPKGHEKKSTGLYLNGYTRGYYGQVSDLPERMAAFAKKNGLIFTGAVYNIYLFDELSVADPEQYLSQVSVAVSETRRVSSRRPKRHL